jgi:hypothetical protein
VTERRVSGESDHEKESANGRAREKRFEDGLEIIEMNAIHKD